MYSCQESCEDSCSENRQLCCMIQPTSVDVGFDHANHPFFPTILLFFLSATPLCCRLWGDSNFCQIPSFAHKFLNSFNTYSPPLSLLRVFTFLPIYFSTSALNSKNLENVWSFFCMNQIQNCHEKSSKNITKSLCLVMEVVEKVPQTSKWILSRTACASLSQSLKVYYVYFPNVHPLHVSRCSSAPLGRLVEIYCMILQAP